MNPPTNRRVSARLESEDYIHIFYTNDRDWSDYVSVDLGDRDSNRRMLNDLSAWQSAANLDYGVVEYHNYSIYAALGLSDFPFLAGNYSTLTTGRNTLYAYMHPLLRNPGPRRLTNSLLARLGWREQSSAADSIESRASDAIEDFFQRRYGNSAREWRDIHLLMSQSVENAKEIFGGESLFYVLLQEVIWADPPYSAAEAAGFVRLYREGGVQDLPGGFSGNVSVRERFRGLDESIRMQEGAAIRWQALLAEPLTAEIRARMEGDVAWFMATASRYRLMAATCDYVLARQNQLDLEEPRTRMAREIAFLEATQVTRDTISPVDQRSFLGLHKALAGIP
jgi:hypothetical protein